MDRYNKEKSFGREPGGERTRLNIFREEDVPIEKKQSMGTLCVALVAAAAVGFTRPDVRAEDTEIGNGMVAPAAKGVRESLRGLRRKKCVFFLPE